jgi:hypothetical protein
LQVSAAANLDREQAQVIAREVDLPKAGHALEPGEVLGVLGVWNSVATQVNYFQSAEFLQRAIWELGEAIQT